VRTTHNIISESASTSRVSATTAKPLGIGTLLNRNVPQCRDTLELAFGMGARQ
jgi:hypothetical protein